MREYGAFSNAANDICLLLEKAFTFFDDTVGHGRSDITPDGTQDRVQLCGVYPATVVLVASLKCSDQIRLVI